MDVSDVFEKKMDAIKCFESQFYNQEYKKQPETYISNKRFLGDITARAKFFGFKIGVEYGEPFFCFEDIKLGSEMLFEI
jgi:hypothetical protein